MYIYIYIYICVCVCIYQLVKGPNAQEQHDTRTPTNGLGRSTLGLPTEPLRSQ